MADLSDGGRILESAASIVLERAESHCESTFLDADALQQLAASQDSWYRYI
jgi:hypothetical protein